MNSSSSSSPFVPVLPHSSPYSPFFHFFHFFICSSCQTLEILQKVVFILAVARSVDTRSYGRQEVRLGRPQRRSPLALWSTRTASCARLKRCRFGAPRSTCERRVSRRVAAGRAPLLANRRHTGPALRCRLVPDI